MLGEIPISAKSGRSPSVASLLIECTALHRYQSRISAALKPLLSKFRKKVLMKSFLMLILLFSTLLCRVSNADTSKRLVRVACVPEAGLLDVESRYLHDSVSGDPAPKRQAERNALLTQAGFHDPHGLKLSCVLGGVNYLITAEQDEPSSAMCGGDPGVFLTVTRNSEKFLSNVIFGGSCGAPSVMRFTIGDGSKSWRGRETEVCYSSGKDLDPDHCEWTFGGPAEFNKRFPIDEDRLRKIVTHQERR